MRRFCVRKICLKEAELGGGQKCVQGGSQLRGQCARALVESLQIELLKIVKFK